MAYTKLHQSLVTSTIWREPNSTRIVWVTMMAMADKDGEVMASIPGLADLARVTLTECEAALHAFLSPDKYSRTKTLEGRRIQEIQGGWCLVNHADYRALASREDMTQKATARMERHRRNKALHSVTERDCHRSVTESVYIAEAQADSEAQAQAEAEADTSAALRASARSCIAPTALVTAGAATVNGHSPADGIQSSEPAADTPAPTDSPKRKRRASPTVPDGSSTAGKAEELAALWADLCGNLPQPALPLAAGIKKAILSSLHRDVIPIWETRFRRVAESDFLSGRKTDFRAGLLWVLGPVNAAKIDSGQYDNHAGGCRPSTPQSCAEALFAAADESERRERSQRAEYTSADERTF